MEEFVRGGALPIYYAGHNISADYHYQLLEKIKDIMDFDPADLFDEYGNLLDIRDMPEGARKLLAGVDVRETIIESADGTENRINRTKKLKW